MEQTERSVELEVECRQLRACRWGFLLLGAGMFLNLALLILPAFWQPSGQSSEQRTPPTFSYFIIAAATLATLIPGAALLMSNARSPRWRQAAGGLLLALGLDCVLVLALCALRPPNVILEAPESLAIRLIEDVAFLNNWLEFWLMAVLVAEFAIACQSSRLVVRMEYLGYGILVGLGATVALIGWTLPSPTMPKDADDFAQLFATVAVVVAMGVQLWLLEALAWAATLARFLSNRCLEVDPKPNDAA